MKLGPLGEVSGEALAAAAILGATWLGVGFVLWSALSSTSTSSEDKSKMSCEDLKTAYDKAGGGDDGPVNSEAGAIFREAVSRDPVCPWAQAILDRRPTCDEFKAAWCAARAARNYTDMARAKTQARAAGCPGVDSWTCA